MAGWWRGRVCEGRAGVSMTCRYSRPWFRAALRVGGGGACSTRRTDRPAVREAEADTSGPRWASGVGVAGLCAVLLGGPSVRRGLRVRLHCEPEFEAVAAGE